MGATVNVSKVSVQRDGIFAIISKFVSAYNSPLTFLTGLLMLAVIIMRYLNASTISCTSTVTSTNPNGVPIYTGGHMILSIAYGCDQGLSSFVIISSASIILILLGSLLALLGKNRFQNINVGNLHKQILFIGIIGIFIAFMFYYGLYMLEPFIILYCIIITYIYQFAMGLLDPSYFGGSNGMANLASIYSQMPWDSRTISVLYTYATTGQFDILMSFLLILWFVLIFMFFRNRNVLISDKTTEDLSENRSIHKIGTYIVMIIGVVYLVSWLQDLSIEGLMLQLFALVLVIRYGSRIIRPFLDPRLLRYVARRLIIIFPLFIAVSIITFLLMFAVYGNPAQTYLYALMGKVCKNVPTSQLASCQAGVTKSVITQFGDLYLPLQVQWLNWFFKFIMGSMGVPFLFTANLPQNAVAAEIVKRIRPTLEITLPATVFAILLSIPLGIIASQHEYSKRDTFINIIVALGLAFPAYLGIIIGIFLFGDLIPILPAFGRVNPQCTAIGTSGTFIPDCFFTVPAAQQLLYVKLYIQTPLRYLIAEDKWDFLAHLLLPFIIISLLSLGVFTLLIRSGMVETMKQDYIMSARASGFSNSVITNKYALRNVLIPIVTLFGLTLATLFAGAPITETVLSWPGLGIYGLAAITQGDFNVIMATGVILAIMIMLGNLLTDILYSVVDPRIRIS